MGVVQWSSGLFGYSSLKHGVRLPLADSELSVITVIVVLLVAPSKVGGSKVGWRHPVLHARRLLLLAAWHSALQVLPHVTDATLLRGPSSVFRLPS